jgi:hypothetical protein
MKYKKTFYERAIPSRKARCIINRLVKAFIFGALGNLTFLTIVMPKNWTEIITIFAMVSFSCVAGGITGVLMALQKWQSWRDEI